MTAPDATPDNPERTTEEMGFAAWEQTTKEICFAAWKEGVVKVAVLAGIPKGMRDGFREKFYVVLDRLTRNDMLRQLSGLSRDAPFSNAAQSLRASLSKEYRFSNATERNDALYNAERAVRVAREAVAKLDDDQRNLIQLAMEELCNWSSMHKPAFFLTVMDRALSNITGKNPDSFPKGKGRGRPKGTYGNWQFQCIVRVLCTLTERYGGHLSFDDKDATKGTLLVALTILRPHLPLVPKCPPLKTIERIRRSRRGGA